MDVNEIIIPQNLLNAVKNNNVHQAYIIEGSLDIDKLQLAKNFATKILCHNKGEYEKFEITNKIADDNYLDILYVYPTPRDTSKVESIKKEDISKIQDFLLKKPFEGDRNIAIVVGIDSMTDKAANKLLKTLEEPPVGSVLILLSENAEGLLDTIKSRSSIIRLNQNNIGQASNSNGKQLIDMLIDEEYFYKISKLIDSIAKDNEEPIRVIDAMEEYYRDILINGSDDRRFTKEYIFKAVDEIEKARGEFRINVNKKYVLKKMALNIGG
ncbi:MAG: hypothetical protein RSB99_03535 [Bacilli bacterium]